MTPEMLSALEFVRAGRRPGSGVVALLQAGLIADAGERERRWVLTPAGEAFFESYDPEANP
jgi:hypothetical protein